jgi:hypothetical protein
MSTNRYVYVSRWNFGKGEMSTFSGKETDGIEEEGHLSCRIPRNFESATEVSGQNSSSLIDCCNVAPRHIRSRKSTSNFWFLFDGDFQGLMKPPIRKVLAPLIKSVQFFSREGIMSGVELSDEMLKKGVTHLMNCFKELNLNTARRTLRAGGWALLLNGYFEQAAMMGGVELPETALALGHFFGRMMIPDDGPGDAARAVAPPPPLAARQGGKR